MPSELTIWDEQVRSARPLLGICALVRNYAGVVFSSGNQQHDPSALATAVA